MVSARETAPGNLDTSAGTNTAKNAPPPGVTEADPSHRDCLPGEGDAERDVRARVFAGVAAILRWERAGAEGGGVRYDGRTALPMLLRMDAGSLYNIIRLSSPFCSGAQLLISSPRAP